MARGGTIRRYTRGRDGKFTKLDVLSSVVVACHVQGKAKKARKFAAMKRMLSSRDSRMYETNE